MRTHARVVIVGGGIMGVGLAYHLGREGWSEVTLIEKGELTSGSTWHAAGLIPHFVGSLNMARVHAYGIDLYQRLEAETGQPTGWHGCGSLRLAIDEGQADWYRHVKSTLDYVGVESHIVGPAEMVEINPLLDPEGVVLAVYTPGDGHTDPSSTTQALAAGARSMGVEIVRNNRVTGIRALPGGEWEVTSEQGTVVCEHVVNAAGSFGAQVGAMVGLDLPIVNMVHQYLVTDEIEAVKAINHETPVVRDPRSSCYYREERGGLIIGPYETSGAEAWGLDGIDWGFDQALLEPEVERLEPHLELAMQRLPCMREAGIKRVVSGPITHTPDGTFLLGPAPGLANHWLCCGASIGITQGAGAGKYLAQWIVHGQSEIAMGEFDPRRYGPWAGGSYAIEKSIEEYHHMYQPHFPGEFRPAGRPVRKTPLYERLGEKGALFGDAYGWERAAWFDHAGVGEELGYRRVRRHDAVGAECRAVRERAGLIDLSSFAKYEVTGPGAGALLDRLCANRLPRRDGRVILGHCLTEAGGIECEMTVTRFAEDRFYVLSAATAEQHDLDWLEQHRNGEQATIRNVTDEYGVLILSGPRARDVLGPLTPAKLDNGDFRWFDARAIDVAGVPVRALRVSYVGELGWELHVPMAAMGTVYEALVESGAPHGLADFGTHALNSLRMEKAYRAWGAELTIEVMPHEAGIESFVDAGKPFVGRDAYLAGREAGPRYALVYLDVDATDADAVGNESVWHDGRVVGVTTGGAYGHATGRSLAFAYVDPGLDGADLTVDLLGEQRPARVLDAPVWDPGNERMRA